MPRPRTTADPRWTARRKRAKESASADDRASRRASRPTPATSIGQSPCSRRRSRSGGAERAPRRLCRASRARGVDAYNRRMLEALMRPIAAGALLAVWCASNPAATAQPPAGVGSVSILAYHRFEPAVRDSMAVRTSAFAWQLRYLADNHYRVVPLRTLVSSLLDRKPLSNAVVITVDDGHRSVYTDMLPLV